MQGTSIRKVGLFWEVVERTNDQGRVEHIVVDTMPRQHGKLPVRVYGPASKADCIEWARQTSLTFMVVTGSGLGDS